MLKAKDKERNLKATIKTKQLLMYKEILLRLSVGFSAETLPIRWQSECIQNAKRKKNKANQEYSMGESCSELKER